MLEIPLQGGAANAHPIFSANLGGRLVDFRLNYITRQDENGSFSKWSLDAYEAGVLKAAGMMLNTGTVINKNYDWDIGDLVFVGDMVNLDNLGSANFLIWNNE